jgi:hypothetical protein
MSLRRKIGGTLAGALAVVALAAAPAVAAPGGNSVKDCDVADSPSKGWMTEGEQKGSCKSSHELEAIEVTNPGGATPPGRQP